MWACSLLLTTRPACSPFALRTGELARDLHQHFHNQIAVALVVEVRNAAPADADFAAALRALGNLDVDGAVDAGDFELVAQCGLRKADGDDAVEVVTLAFEEVVRTDREHDVKIALGACGTAASPSPV